MNNRQNGRRRGRGPGQPQQGGGRNGGPDRGNRIDNRARGNASQLHEKYKALARDAQTQGDRVNTEYYLQFADHYFRVLSESRARFEEQRPRQDENARDGNFQDGEADDGFYADDDRVDPQGFVEADRHEPRNQYAREDRPQQRDDREDRPREDRQRDDRPRGDRQDRQREDRPRREQADQQPQPMAAEAQAAPSEDRRPRRRRVEAQPANDGGETAVERIEIDRLPPAFAAEPRLDAEPANDLGDGEERPRTRRPRRPRSEAVVADA